MAPNNPSAEERGCAAGRSKLAQCDRRQFHRSELAKSRQAPAPDSGVLSPGADRDRELVSGASFPDATNQLSANHDRDQLRGIVFVDLVFLLDQRRRLLAALAQMESPSLDRA